MSNHGKEDVGKLKEPNFHCTICGKGFATQSSLVLHHEKKHQEMLLEHGVPKQPKHKPYICGTCNKSYTTESALVIHSSKVKFTFKRILSWKILYKGSFNNYVDKKGGGGVIKKSTLVHPGEGVRSLDVHVDKNLKKRYRRIMANDYEKSYYFTFCSALT